MYIAALCVATGNLKVCMRLIFLNLVCVSCCCFHLSVLILKNVKSYVL
jgi:hypothetical protein